MTPRGRDEHAVFDRPGTRGNRRRTKQRPDHADATRGFVMAVDRGRYTVLLAADTADERAVNAMKARELGRDRVVVGDHVDVVGDTSGDPGTLVRIVRIAARTSVLRRTADDTDPYERIVVANADQLVIVTALAQPEPRTGMIDRAAVAAYDAGMDVLLCLTKADIAAPDELRALYEPLGVSIVVTRRLPEGKALDPASLDVLRAALHGRVSVLLGHSGVGKSTLVNALVPGAGRTTGQVNDVTGRGRHTSTSAVALRLPTSVAGVAGVAGVDRADRADRADGATGAVIATEAGATEPGGGWVIDTPGVRSFGLAHVTIDNVLAAFEDLDEAAADCPRGCTHLADSPDCALDDWVADAPDDHIKAAHAARLASFRRVLTARTSG